MSSGELIFYRSDDGRAEIQLRAEGDTVWLTQAADADDLRELETLENKMKKERPE